MRGCEDIYCVQQKSVDIVTNIKSAFLHYHAVHFTLGLSLIWRVTQSAKCSKSDDVIITWRFIFGLGVWKEMSVMFSNLTYFDFILSFLHNCHWKCTNLCDWVSFRVCVCACVSVAVCASVYVCACMCVTTMQLLKGPKLLQNQL